MPRSRLSMAKRALLNGCGALARDWLEQDCVLCDAPSGAEPICASCAAELPRLPPHCPRCALPAPGGLPCGACLAHPPAFDASVSAWAYAYPADRLVRALKYHARLQLAGWFARQLAMRMTTTPDWILPVPLHASRLAERGFNQALEIGRILSNIQGVTLAATGVERIRPTLSQADLPPGERARNVHGAFRCTLRLHGGSVAVVDDVMTTGATLQELARTLKRAGAARVTNVVVTRTLIDS